jgi:hypothetical protein
LNTPNAREAVSVYTRLAKLLNVRIDDLVSEATAEAHGPE